ncbi:biotin--[acetyl-CoA-carboxylase] ligase [Thermococcus sp. Bubb.Bath]|uniref:biotin--[acetyl-CoA-carboxylase] ligase n=1 Tax=Thermococcus sp. Bubb.Bath TaxID=1638242 RepID=UPI00143CAB66|nr:biotin--[acetyl-CoA-carboxylase] ligase [Thermococcus sp. Bubb.Bath]NJF24922.1 biotin--[acetyl-CoA-carboxylase] ligase [Thermococcus sp. Bubb.Bath]
MRPLKDSPAKRRILSLLREREIVSGETLGEELGVSRTAVWKHIEELKRLEYGISSTPSGYKLVHDPRIPYPWELEVEALYYRVTKSTMDEARKLAEKGVPSGLFVIAGEQRSGKGRRGRSWHSPPGGLYFSLILRPEIPMDELWKVEESSTRAIVGFLGTLGIEAKASGSGVFVNNKKIGGILTEAYGELEAVNFAILGVGLNVNNPAPPGGISLSAELGRELGLLDVTEGLFGTLLSELSWAVRG